MAERHKSDMSAYREPEELHKKKSNKSDNSANPSDGNPVHGQKKRFAFKNKAGKDAGPHDDIPPPPRDPSHDYDPHAGSESFQDTNAGIAAPEVKKIGLREKLFGGMTGSKGGKGAKVVR